MANTIKLGTNGNWATKEGSLLAYNDENNNFKPLPFTTTRASSASVVNKQGLIETVGSGIPRIDFSDDANGALLLEPSRSNAIQYSEDFTQWTSINVTVNSNVANSPNGTLTADRITFDGTTNARVETTAQGINSFEGTKVRPNSVWLKTESGTTTVQIGSSSSFLLTVTVTQEWQRFTLNSRQGFARIRSDNATSVLAWGYQFETNGDVSLSYATSYIPTLTGTTQTRVADTASDSGNSTVINSTEGVLYAEISALADDGTFRLISLSDATTNNRLSLGYRSTSNAIYCEIKNANVAQAFLLGTVADIKNVSKVAIKYKENDFALFINGIEVATDPSGLVPSNLSVLTFSRADGALPFYGNVKSVQVYTTALTDAELTTLTTI